MRRSPLRLALAVAAIALVALLRYASDSRAPERTPPAAPREAPEARATRPAPTVAESPAPASSASDERSGSSQIRDAFAKRRSDVWVEGSGTVEATLPDDREGSRHQKFVVRLDRDLTVLVSHNIDLAPRVPLDRGDRVSFRGEYVWNAKGGIVHWTHRDPRGGRGGWIRLGNEVFE